MSDELTATSVPWQSVTTDAKTVAQLRPEWEKRYQTVTEEEINAERSAVVTDFQTFYDNLENPQSDYDYYEEWLSRRYALLRLELKNVLSIYVNESQHAETQLGIKEGTIARLEAQLHANQARNRLCATLLEMVNAGSFTHREKDGALKLIAQIMTHANPAEFVTQPGNGNGNGAIPF